MAGYQYVGSQLMWVTDSGEYLASKPTTSTAPAASDVAKPDNPSNLNFDTANTAVTNMQNQLTTLQNTTTAQSNQLYSMVNAQTAQANATKQGQQTNWITAGKELLNQYNLSGLGNVYVDMITTKGLDNNTAILELQSTPEWKQRFSANEARLKQGLPVLDPATYLATEEKYKDVLIAGGLSSSVVNDVSYLGQLIAKDVSPIEVQQRIDAARTVIANEDTFVKQQLQQQFGLTTGDMVLHILDPQAAAPVITQKVNAAKIGAEFERQNVGMNQATAAQYAAQGVTQAQAQQAAVNLAATIAPTQELAQRYDAYAPNQGVGAAITTAELVGAGAGQAQVELQRLKTQEIAGFSGSSGAGKGSLMGTDEGVS